MKHCSVYQTNWITAGTVGFMNKGRVVVFLNEIKATILVSQFNYY